VPTWPWHFVFGFIQINWWWWWCWILSVLPIPIPNTDVGPDHQHPVSCVNCLWWSGGYATAWWGEVMTTTFKPHLVISHACPGLYFLPNLSAVICWQLPPCWHQGVWAIWALGMTTGAALATNPRPLQTHLSCPACIASGNFILEFPSINSPILSVEQTTSLARACVNVRIGEFMALC